MTRVFSVKFWIKFQQQMFLFSKYSITQFIYGYISKTLFNCEKKIGSAGGVKENAGGIGAGDEGAAGAGA